jgi:sn-glycerol 3-phosphate transport system ATP-binding protein
LSGISLEQLSKRFGDQKAVDDVSFEVKQGEFCVLLGPSGCGKSTTLRMIAGLEEPTGGSIVIGDRDVTHLPPSRRQISMVFQSYALFPHLTVGDNIVFGLRMRGVARGERDVRLKRVSELVGLGDMLDRRPAQLSGGQRQRVALARAIVSEQPVCLMDEPLSNLDAKLRHEMRVEIRGLQLRLGITMVYVTHDQVEAMTMADRIVLMNAGRIEQIGSPVDLYARPASLFAARFIGAPAMNLIAGASVGRPDRIIGVRAEDIRLAACNEVGLPGHVHSVEYLGADSVIGVKVSGCDVVNVRVAGLARVTPGAAVTLFWDRSGEHAFHAHSGGRLASDSHTADRAADGFSF